MAAATFRHLGFGARAIDYMAAWEQQRDLHRQVVAGDAPDTVLLLEHTPVYTAGKRTEPHERPLDGTPVVDVDRGGKITWHGPGQLVGYPICRLPGQVYVVDYVRRLEEAMIAICADLGVSTGRIRGRSGVWLPGDEHRQERKIGAIGVRVSQGVTMHGLALNANCDLGWYDQIVPCGIADAAVTNLSVELRRDVTVQELVPLAEKHLGRMLAWATYTPSPEIPRPRPDASEVTYGLQPLA